MTVYISNRHWQLTKSFDELKAKLQTPTCYIDQQSVGEIINEFDRYRVWADNVGAAKYGRSYSLSLDYRLRDATFYKDQASNNTIITNYECFYLVCQFQLVGGILIW